MKKILISALVVMGLIGAPLAIASPAAAVTVDPCQNMTKEARKNSVLCAESKTTAEDVIKIIIDTILYLVGAIAVIMIIYSGLRYLTSAGNQNAVTSAKNTLLYSVIGLAVAMFAWTIVNWVFQSIESGDPGSSANTNTGKDDERVAAAAKASRERAAQ